MTKAGRPSGFWGLYVFQRLGDVVQQVLGIFQAAAQTDQVGAHTGGFQLLIVHLAMGCGSGMQAAGAGVCHMGLDGTQLQVLHEHLGRLSSAVEAEGNDAAGAVGQVFLSDLVILVALQAAVLHPLDLLVVLQVSGDGVGVGAVLLHAEGQALQTQVQHECILGGLDAAEVTHQLGGTLGDESALQAETLGVGDAMVAVVGGGQAGELVGVGSPVELAGVDNDAAHGGSVTIHILGGGMGDDVSAPLEGTAVDGGGEGVVHDQGHAVGMGGLGELLNVQHRQGRVGDGLAENQLGVGPEGGVQLLLGAVGIHEGGFQTHLLHGHGEQVEAAAVDGGTGHDVVAAASDVEHGHEGGSLAGAGEHGSGAALQGADLGRHGVAGGVLQTGVEIAAGLQVKELAHILGGIVLERGTLNDGDLAGLAVAGGIARLDAQGFCAKLGIHNGSPQF